eukprot:SAG31_NODE_2985_length_4812_cov_3.398517_2_plen_180_part_00
MVYTEYTVSARAFGEYEPCNPCQTKPPTGGGGDAPPQCPPGKVDGTFVCESYGASNSPPPPPQCAGKFDIWHRDCLNGTVFKTLSSATEGECCQACSAAGSECAGWNMPAGYNGSVCQLMKEPLVQWNDGQTLSQCKSAETDHGGSWWDRCCALVCVLHLYSNVCRLCMGVNMMPCRVR